MTRATTGAGFDGPVFDSEGRRVITPADPSEALLMDFTLESPRSYRGPASGRSGHSGTRVSKKLAEKTGLRAGAFLPNADEHGNQFTRRRWTTALRPDALDHLHALSEELGIPRCEVVERLLLDPECRRRLAEED